MPAAQASHTALSAAPTAGEAVPAAHSVHALTLPADQVPALQLVHSKLYPFPSFEKSLKNPALQTHFPYADPAAELELAGHAEHVSVPPSEYSPSLHALHTPAPAPDTVPAGHHLQVEAFVALSAADAVPLEHRVHVSLSPPYGASSNVPTGHG